MCKQSWDDKRMLLWCTCSILLTAQCTTKRLTLPHLKACIAAFNFAVLLKGQKDLPRPALVHHISCEAPHVEEGLQHLRPQLVGIAAGLHVVCWMEPHHFWR